MKKLLDIVSGYPIRWDESQRERSVTGISLDSRSVKPGFLFAALRGATSDGHKYIGQAVANGATVVLCEETPRDLPAEVLVLEAEDSRKALAVICRNFYNDPSRDMTLVGVTGTNGKSTIVHGLYELMNSMGYRTGMLSTIRNAWSGHEEESALTTPDIVNLHRMLAAMRADAIDYVFMEVSSHALDQRRVEGLRFDIAVFTNLSRDHLDYHESFAAYRDAKKILFDELDSTAKALVNVDDKNGVYMLQNCDGIKLRYALRHAAEYKGKMLDFDAYGMELKINEARVHSRLIGDFNASNLLAMYAVLNEIGLDSEDALLNISQLKAPRGRMETVENDKGILAVVDYAHTPDALSKVLQALAKLKRSGSRLITVVGCGGDRDRGKRPLMARSATEQSDISIFSSDNPRTEDPEKIIEDMLAGVGDDQEVLSIVDRREAIAKALTIARRGDIVLIAGKGHETYQEVQNKKHHFDDREEVLKILSDSR